MRSIHFFINTLSSGGAEHQLSILANLLSQRDYDVSIVTFGGGQDHYPLDKKIKRICLCGHSNGILRMFQIWKYFATVKTDCVISFGVRENALAIPGLLLRKGIMFIAGERNITMQNQPRYEKICHKFLYRRANYIVPNSYSQERYLKQYFPRLEDKIVTITNYTDLTEFVPDAGYTPNSNRLVVVARYYPQKNWYRFAEAVSKLKEQIGASFVIDCYGSQKFSSQVLQDYYDGLVLLIEKLGIGDVLRLHDSIKNVAEEMNHSDAVCLPSLHEGFSNTISEAICCGKPVICSDVADNSVMVHDRENGFLFNPLDIDEMADAMNRFIDLPVEKKKQMGMKSRKISESLFDVNVFVNAYEKLILSK